MLEITVGGKEIFNEETNEFSISNSFTLQLEHSLLSLSKWESKHKKSFLHSDKDSEESLDYIKCMTITRNVPDYVYLSMSEENLVEISEYIKDTMTATTINFHNNQKKENKIVTAEVIYYWMISLNIPMEFQKWHLNKLMTLIQVCSVENSPKKNMSKKETLAQNRSLNAARRARMNSKG